MDYELRVIRNNLDKFKVCFESLLSSISSKERYESELSKQVDINANYQLNYIKDSEQINQNPGYLMSGKTGTDTNPLRSLDKSISHSNSKSPTASRLNHTLKGDIANQSSPMTKVNSKKMNDLQQNNDQLFNELRKANEKYLDVRVENNKLKDQITTLKHSLETAKTKEIKRHASASVGGVSSSVKRKQAVTQREDGLL